MRSFGRCLGAFFAIGLLATACTSRTTAQQGSTGSAIGSNGSGLAAANDSASSTIGITDDAINVAFLGVDFSALASTGLVPDLGDQAKQVNAFVDDINAKGGIGGRKINLKFKLLNVLAGGADALQAACIEVTQEFKAAVVVLPPAAIRELTRCTSVTNKTLTIHATGMDDDLYKESQGRLFTPNGMSINRQFTGWAQQIDQLGLLKDKKVGVVLGDQPSEFVAPTTQSLLPELEKLGHKPAEVITLPCSSGSTSCDQYDAAAQKLKDAGVDVVFMELANTFGTGLVQAATNIGYHPKWVVEGNQATDTVSKFYESAKQDWNGTVGLAFSFNSPADIGPSAVDCNKVVTGRSGDKYEPGSDAFGFAATVCAEFRVLDLAGDKVDKPALNQGALISAIEGLGTFDRSIGPAGTLSPTKHDGLNNLFLCDYQADVGKCVRRPGDPPAVGD